MKQRLTIHPQLVVLLVLLTTALPTLATQEQPDERKRFSLSNVSGVTPTFTRTRRS